jgi:hypothetical protein
VEQRAAGTSPKLQRSSGICQDCMAAEKVRLKYEKIAKKMHKRPFDMAVSDYFKGNNLPEK